jgi:tetratricopeptide (TPR) repeat protein
VAEDRRYLGNVLYDLGELAKARDELERALAIDESTFGPDHWRVGEDWRHLAVVLRDLGELRAESPNQPPGH